MEKITALLMREHSFILLTKEVLKKTNLLWTTEPSSFENTMHLLLNFCRQYADKIHHHKEEQLLFPSMIDQNPMLEQTLIGEMLEHHETFREYAQKIHQYLENKKYAEAYHLFTKYLSLLEDHIAVENDELFPMADDLLPSLTQETLYYRSLDFDRDFKEQKESLEKQIKHLSSPS